MREIEKKRAEGVQGRIKVKISLATKKRVGGGGLNERNSMYSDAVFGVGKYVDKIY